jgi:hypothetical protein
MPRGCIIASVTDPEKAAKAISGSLQTTERIRVPKEVISPNLSTCSLKDVRCL